MRDYYDVIVGDTILHIAHHPFEDADISLYVHPIILYACSAHVQSVKVVESDTISS